MSSLLFFLLTFGFCSVYYKVMEEEINEFINVKAYFSTGKVFPYLISYRKREIPIKKINISYKTKDGDLTVFNFSLLGSGATYYVIFYPEKLLWKLLEIKPM